MLTGRRERADRYLLMIVLQVVSDISQNWQLSSSSLNFINVI